MKNNLFHNTNAVCVASLCLRCDTNIALCAKGSAEMRKIMRGKYYRLACVGIGITLALCVGCSKQGSQTSTKSPDQTKATDSADPGEEQEASQYFSYEIDEEEKYITITSYLDESEDSIVIPDSIYQNGETYPVTEIADEAFYYNTEVKHIKIPDSVKVIGKEAFCKCEALEEIEIPGTVENLGVGLFFDCTSLKKVTFGKGIVNLPDELFTNCESLAEVELPDTLTSIGNEAFWSCTSLKELDLPQNVVMIGERSFYSSGLKKITLRSTAINISEDMFEGADELKSIYVSKNLVKTFEDTAVDAESITVNAIED